VSEKYYIARYGKTGRLYLNLPTGQFQKIRTEEVLADSHDEALLHASALAFHGALVYKVDSDGA
jgi:hypothetical protein